MSRLASANKWNLALKGQRSCFRPATAAAVSCSSIVRQHRWTGEPGTTDDTPYTTLPPLSYVKSYLRTLRTLGLPVQFVAEARLMDSVLLFTHTLHDNGLHQLSLFLDYRAELPNRRGRHVSVYDPAGSRQGSQHGHFRHRYQTVTT